MRRGWGVATAGAIGVVAGLLGVAAQTTLWDRDEPRFAQATVEMVRSGNYLYPTFNESLRPDKPILVYWLMSVPVRLFGAGELAVRAVAAVSMAIAALATYAAGRWLFTPATGLLASAILVTTPLSLVEGAAATSDALLLACVTVGFATFVHAFVHGWRPIHGLVLALACGAGLLTKGPVGIGVPLAGIAAAWWWGRAHTTLRPRHLGWIAAAAVVGMALFFAWAIPANAATGGGLARGGIGHHVVRRMLEPLEGHGGSPVLYLPYYLVVIAAGFFPWTLYLPGAVSALARGRLGHPARALLLGWALPTLVIMTLVVTKLPHYVLPIWPALAIAVAGTVVAACRDGLDERARRWLRRGPWLAGVTAAAIAAGLIGLPHWLPAPGLGPWAIAAGLVVLLMTGFAIREQRRGRVDAATIVLLGGVVSFDAVLALGVLPAVDRLKPSPPLAAAIESSTAAGIPVVTRGYREPSLVFYLEGREVRPLRDDSALIRWVQEPGPGVLVAPRDLPAQISDGGLRELAAVRGYNFGAGSWVELVAVAKEP